MLLSQKTLDRMGSAGWDLSEVLTAVDVHGLGGVWISCLGESP